MIVFFLPNLQVGGAERVMLHILNAFAENNSAEVGLLLGRKKGNLLSEVNPNIPIFELGADSATTSVLPLIRFCKKHQPKKIIASLGSSLAVAIAKAFLPKNIEIISRLGNTIGAEKLLISNPLKRKMYIAANTLIAKKSDKMIFQCNYMSEDFFKETKVKSKLTKVIYNPVDTDKIKNLANEKNQNPDFDFVAVGRLSEQKDYFTLIKAFEILKNQFQKNYNVLILGEGNLRNQLEKEIKSRNLENQVILKGLVGNPFPYMKQAKALLSTSLYEGFSNVIVEALCLGTPVIASDCPGANREVLQENQNGFLFETGNPMDLAQKIINNFENLHSLNRSEIQEKAQQKYNVNHIFEQYKDFISK